MAKRYTRESILQSMRDKIAAGEMLLACGVGTGLIARLCDQAGVDLVGVYNSGRYRMNGIAAIAGNLPIGDANAIMYDIDRKSVV